jgi:hypothetical protein
MDEADLTARQRLDAVIAEAWEILSAYQFEQPLELCRCDFCVTPEAERLLLVTPVADMSAALLQDYTESAHVSSPLADRQFRALLPRYFQLCGAGEWPAQSVEVTFRRLRDAEAWTRWPAREVEIVKRFFVALFETWLTDTGELGRTEADAILCLPVYAGGRVEPLLAAWETCESVEGALKLADFIHSLSRDNGRNWFGAFWEDHQMAQEHVFAWLKRPEVYLLLDAAQSAAIDPREQRRLSEAALLL